MYLIWKQWDPFRIYRNKWCRFSVFASGIGAIVLTWKNIFERNTLASRVDLCWKCNAHTATNTHTYVHAQDPDVIAYRTYREHDGMFVVKNRYNMVCYTTTVLGSNIHIVNFDVEILKAFCWKIKVLGIIRILKFNNLKIKKKKLPSWTIQITTYIIDSYNIIRIQCTMLEIKIYILLFHYVLIFTNGYFPTVI